MTDAEMIETTAQLRAATEAIHLITARAMINWDLVERLVRTSRNQDDARDLLELAAQELRDYGDFPQVCANAYRI